MNCFRSLTAMALSLGLSAAYSAELPIHYTVPRDGRVSLAVYNADGQLVRTLLTGKPHAKGSHSAAWDGLDRYGRALPPGDYEWRMLSSTGLTAQFITQVGQNPKPIWEKGVGNHEPPTAAAVDATGVYRIGAFDEGTHFGVKTDLAGRYLWTTHRDKVDPWCKFGAAITLVSNRLFDLIHNGTIYHYNATTGESYTKGNGDGLWNFRWEGGPAKVDGKTAESLRTYVTRVGMDLSGSTRANVLAASYRQHNAVRWFNPANGSTLGEATVPEPIAVAVRDDGSVLVISKGAVVAVSRHAAEPKVIIPPTELRAAWRLSVSPANGDIFVAENSDVVARDGTATHRVKRFSREGRWLGSFGKPSGRGDGVYLGTEFRGITDIEADPSGGFVISEGNNQIPRRSAHLDADGKLLREWFGAQQYGVIACPEPGNPEFVWFHVNATKGGYVRCRVDYQTGEWRIVETYRDSLARNALWGSGSSSFRIHERGGLLYFTATGAGSLSTLIYDPAKKTMRVANLSGTAFKDNRWRVPESLREEGQRGGFIWNDLNDDGDAQREEMVWLNRSGMGGPTDATDFTMFTTPHPSSHQPGPKLTPARFTAGGTPVYDFDPAATWPAWNEDDTKARGWDILRAPDGGWYSCFSSSLSNPVSGHENHGAWYYNSCSGIDRLVKWDKDWQQLWSVGRHSPDHDHETGSTAMPRGLVGVAHGCVIWADASDAEVSRPTVWTDDGLYVDELLRLAIDQLPKEMHGQNNANEFATGNIALEPGSSNVLYFAVTSMGGAPIYRIAGWNGWERASGKLKLNAAATAVAKRDGSGLKTEFFNNFECRGEPVFTRTDKVVYFHWLKNRDKLPEGVNADAFSVRWSGQVEAATTGRHRFSFETMTPWIGDGWGTHGKPKWLKLWVGGVLVIDTTQGVVQETTHGICGDVRLRAGGRYDLKLECSYSGNAVAKLGWETPSLDRRTILPAFLHPSLGSGEQAQAVVEKRPELIADFSFEEPAGAISRSSAGLEIFGRLTGNTRRVAGRSGQALQFQAGGQYEPALFCLDEELRLPDADYTVVFWFKTTDASTGLAEARRYSSYNNRWSDHVVSVSEGRVRFALQGDAPIESAAAVNDGKWHHIVTTVGPGGQRLYVDGQLAGTGKLARRTRITNRLPLDLGPGKGRASVTIDDLKIFGRVLAETDVAKLSTRK